MNVYPIAVMIWCNTSHTSINDHACTVGIGLTVRETEAHIPHGQSE